MADQPRSKNTTPAEKLAMLNWLQTSANFNLINGKAAEGTNVVAGNKLKKTDAYKSLALYVNGLHKSGWSVESAKSRYETFVAKYKAAKRASLKTGFGVTEADIEKGVETIEQKLESMATHFAELDALYGDRANVAPTSLLESNHFERETISQASDSASILTDNLIGSTYSDFDWDGNESLDQLFANAQQRSQMNFTVPYYSDYMSSATSTPTVSPYTVTPSVIPFPTTPTVVPYTQNTSETPSVSLKDQINTSMQKGKILELNVPEQKTKTELNVIEQTPKKRKQDFGSSYIEAEANTQKRLQKQFEEEMKFKRECRSEDLKQQMERDKAAQKADLLKTMIAHGIPFTECLANLAAAGFN